MAIRFPAEVSQQVSPACAAATPYARCCWRGRPKTDGSEHPDVGRAAKKNDVPCQRTAGECRARPQVCLWADPRLALQPSLHLLGVGSRLLAKGRKLIDESHRCRQEGIQRMLRHFGRLNTHPLNVPGEGGEQRSQTATVSLRSGPDHDSLRPAKGIQCLAEPQILRRISETYAAAGCLSGMPAPDRQ